MGIIETLILIAVILVGTASILHFFGGKG